MEEYLMNDGVFLFQLICAGLCGMAVGIERQSRMKSAGVRTHFVVAMASALMMIVSKYGFLDVIIINGASVDVSRVAAGIISGIGILGGGLNREAGTCKWYDNSSRNMDDRRYRYGDGSKDVCVGF